jgi:hypothetical protein
MPGEREEVSSAEVYVKLTSRDSASAFIHSMRPDRLLDSTAVTASTRLDADFKLAKMGVGGEAKFNESNPFLLAFPLGAEGYWQFTQTRQTAVAGQYHLQFIVRAPSAKDAVHGTIGLSLEVKGRRFFIASHSNHDRVAEVGFSCS